MASKPLPYLTAADRLRCILDDNEGLTGRKYTVDELSALLEIESTRLHRILHGYSRITLPLAFLIVKLSRRYSVMWLIGGSLTMNQTRLRYVPFKGEWELTKTERLTAPGQWTRTRHVIGQRWRFSEERRVPRRTYPAVRSVPASVEIAIPGEQSARRSWQYDRSKRFLQVGMRPYYVWQRDLDSFVLVGQESAYFIRYTFTRLR